MPTAQTLEIDMVERTLEHVIGTDPEVKVPARGGGLPLRSLAWAFLGVSDRGHSSRPLSVKLWIILNLMQ